MYMQLVRPTEIGEKSTEGHLLVNGTSECFTLEDKDRKLEDGGEKIYGKTAIPRGIYDIKITYSNRFKKDLPLLIDVPQFEGVRIHAGNSSEDTDGCILVGTVNKDPNDDWIGASRKALDSLQPKIQDALDRGEEVTIEIV